MDADDRRALGRSIIRRVVRHHAETLANEGEALWPLDLEHAYATAVDNAIFGYGRLQPLFEIPTAENIEIHGHDSVVIQHGDGHRDVHPPVADSDDELIEAIRFLGETTTPTRPFDDAHPMMTMALGAKFRLHAIGFGLSYRPSIVIRQHILTTVTLKDLAATGMMPPEIAQLLHDCVLARKSIVVSGDQGAGKTTLLRGLIAAIPRTERFGTLETDYELLTHLLPGRRNILALQAKTGLGETLDGRSLGEYTVADLIPETLRQNLSRSHRRRGARQRGGGDVRGDAVGPGHPEHHPLALGRVHDRPAGVAGGPGRRPHDRRGLPADRPQHPPAGACAARRRHLAGRASAAATCPRSGCSRVRSRTNARSRISSTAPRRPLRRAEFHPDPALDDELREFRGAWEAP